MPQDEGREILRHAAEYQYREWHENADFEAYRAFCFLMWMTINAEEFNDSIV